MNLTDHRSQHHRTELPGPKARALLARDAEVVSPSYPRDYRLMPPPTVTREQE